MRPVPVCSKCGRLLLSCDTKRGTCGECAKVFKCALTLGRLMNEDWQALVQDDYGAIWVSWSSTGALSIRKISIDRGVSNTYQYMSLNKEEQAAIASLIGRIR